MHLHPTHPDLSKIQQEVPSGVGGRELREVRHSRLSTTPDSSSEEVIGREAMLTGEQLRVPMALSSQSQEEGKRVCHIAILMKTQPVSPTTKAAGGVRNQRPLPHQCTSH